VSVEVVHGEHVVITRCTVCGDVAPCHAVKRQRERQRELRAEWARAAVLDDASWGWSAVLGDPSLDGDTPGRP
jgi:hypothetical protein